MESIVSRESENRITGDEEEEIMEFTQLRTLKLISLPRLISFYSSGNCTPNPTISSSQERQEHNQRLPNFLFNKKVVLPKLVELQLESLKVDRILATEAESINCCFQNLTFLEVRSCPNLSYLFTSFMVKSLAQLKKLKVELCKSIEEIVATKGEMAGDEDEIVEFTQLRKLELIRLGRLISFYSSGNSTPNPTISSSQERQEHNYRLPNFLFNKKLAFPNLEHVEIRDCPNLTSIFPASVALALKQLKYLRICGCENLKEIVSNEEEEDGGPPFVFPKLTTLVLWRLPELDISDWPSLGKLDVRCCDKLIDPSNLNIQKIISPSLKYCRLQGTNVCVRYKGWSGQLEVTSCNVLKYLFSSHLALRGLLCLKEIRVQGCESMETIVSRESENRMCDDHRMLPVGSLQNLTSIHVSSCNVLKYLFSSHLALRGLLCLKEIYVIRCESMESIVSRVSENRITVDNQLDEEEEIIEFIQLRKLDLSSLPRLISFYSSGNSTTNPTISSSQGRQEHIQRLPNFLFNKKLAFPNLEQVEIDGIHKVKMIWENQLHLNLRDVTVFNCPNLTSIFSASVALTLKQLTYLSIEDCENLKEIVSNKEEEDGGPPTFVFPRLNFLKLKRLPELERFYGGGVDISDWPSLRSLSVDCYDKLIDPSNLNIQKIISPSLGTCKIKGTNFKVTYQWYGQLKVDGDIQKIGCSSVFPIALFEMFQQFKKVHIARVCFEQLFPCEHDVGDDQFDGIPLNLEILEVESCGSLMSLAPKSALFQNLTRLVVRGCNELIKLVASSTTAKSLVNLTEMRVSECDSLKEIVAIYDDHDGEEASNNSTEDIIFGKLKTLVLKSLRSLTSFTTNNCNFQFPSLEQVTVAECPNLEFFSKGALSTPKLSGVWVSIDDDDEEEGRSMSESDDYDEEEGRSMSESDDYDEEEGRSMWESDLNSTVRQLYKAMNSTDEYLEPE